MIHITPNTAMAAKVTFQPKARYKAAITGAATTLPNEAPAPKMPWQWLVLLPGTHSALLLVAPGQLPASLDA